MQPIKFYPHQHHALYETRDHNRVAYYHDMGLGKTFTGAEKMYQLGAELNLVICQKSKVADWVNHFKEYYPMYRVFDLTDKKQWNYVLNGGTYLLDEPVVLVINYELTFRRPELKELVGFTLMLDESSMIQNENAKRSKFILSLKADNVILLSGTPTGGKYEKLWSQLHLLGWNISKDLYWRQYIDTEIVDNEGFPIKVVRGYKNVDRLKHKLREHGAHFLKTEDVFDLPQQTFNTVSIQATKEYRKFRKSCIVHVDGKWKNYVDESRHDVDYHTGVELVGDTTLTKMLYERQLCGQYNKSKIDAFRDILESTNDRLIVFYNFTAEMEIMRDIVNDVGREYSRIDGSRKDLTCYDNFEDSVTFVQYQAGAMGLNLQKANKVIYFTPPLSSELFEQSKKRIHRIGQDRPCFYYFLTCKNSIEEKIYDTLAMRRDYTEVLFESEV